MPAEGRAFYGPLLEHYATLSATVVASAALRGDLVVTGDENDLRELAAYVPGVTIISMC